jgi:hypothetical protein
MFKMPQDKAGAAKGTNASELSQKELEDLLSPERGI